MAQRKGPGLGVTIMREGNNGGLRGQLWVIFFRYCKYLTTVAIRPAAERLAKFTREWPLTGGYLPWQVTAGDGERVPGADHRAAPKGRPFSLLSLCYIVPILRGERAGIRWVLRHGSGSLTHGQADCLGCELPQIGDVTRSPIPENGSLMPSEGTKIS
jgi:hypothetical protein